MIDFNKAKEKYNSAEIPQELEIVVENSIKHFEQKKKSREKIRFVRLAPVAICAVICLVIGISTLPESEQKETLVTEESAAVGIPKLARNVPAADAGNGISADEAPAAAVAATESAAEFKADSKMSMYNMYVAEKIDKSIEDSVETETSDGAYGEVTELYSDENVYSYCVTTYPSNTAKFYNVKQNDGAEITLRELLKDANEFEDCEFYFKSANCIVVICDGEEKEIILE